MGGFGYVLRVFAGDMIPMAAFLGVLLASGSVAAATMIGAAAALAQVGWALARRKAVGALQWASLGLIAVLGGATLLTRDPRFIMIKPSVVHLIVGAVMLRRGWMERYVPAEIRAEVRSTLTLFGFVWASLMFLTAALNLALAFMAEPVIWARFNLVFPPASMIGLFALQNIIMRRRLTNASFCSSELGGGSLRSTGDQPTRTKSAVP